MNGKYINFYLLSQDLLVKIIGFLFLVFYCLVSRRLQNLGSLRELFARKSLLLVRKRERNLTLRSLWLSCQFRFQFYVLSRLSSTLSFCSFQLGSFLDMNMVNDYGYNLYLTTPNMAQKPKRPEQVNGVRVRMPEDYDFNTWGKDFSQYNKDYKLRTDAVWEKQQLKDWFRLTNKVFYFNKKEIKYQWVEPEDIYMLTFEPWGFEDDDIMDWDGYSATGCSTNFQAGLGPKQKVQNTFNSFYSMPDYYIMCAMRFEKWFKCDQIYYKNRSKDFDRNPEYGLTNLKDSQHYPCFREYYETRYACADNILNFLVQLSYQKRARGFFREDVSNTEIQSFPTIYDSPTAPQNITYTY